MEVGRRCVSFDLINALLKVRCHLMWNGGLPDYELLRPKLVALKEEMVRRHRVANALPAGGSRGVSVCGSFQSFPLPRLR